MGNSTTDPAGSVSSSSCGGAPESLKELVLRAGMELLELHGLALTFETISYARVFDYLREEYGVTVTRGSVHERIWPSQDDFRRDVLTESIAYFPPSSITEVVLNRDFPAGSVAEFTKDLGLRALPELVRSQMSGRFQSVKALASWFDDPVAIETLHGLLSERANQAIARGKLEFPVIAARLGLQPRAAHGRSDTEIASLCVGVLAVLIEGGLLNYHAGTHDITNPVSFRSSKSDGDPWLALSVGVNAVMEFFYEPATEPVEVAKAAPSPLPTEKVPDVEPYTHLPPASSRRPRSQLRDLVLTAAVELLVRDGADLKPELLNYGTVFAHIYETTGITVHRSSVHRRIWANNDEFRYEVLKRSIEFSSKPVKAVSDAIVDGHPVRRPDGSVDPMATARQVFRVGSVSIPSASSRAFSYRTLLQIKASLIDQDDLNGRAELRAKIAEVEKLRMEGNKAEFRSLILDLGFRVRPDIDMTEDEAIELFETLTMTTAAGVVFNEAAGVALVTKPFSIADPSGSGDRTKWTLLGLAICSYFEQLFEEVH